MSIRLCLRGHIDHGAIQRVELLRAAEGSVGAVGRSARRPYGLVYRPPIQLLVRPLGLRSQQYSAALLVNRAVHTTCRFGSRMVLEALETCWPRIGGRGKWGFT